MLFRNRSKDVVPRLRRWFGHDAGRWDDFVRRYSAELDARPESWRRYFDARLTRERRDPRGSPAHRSAAARER
jgi:uncharacterized protein YeaO (DUF488 family)